MLVDDVDGGGGIYDQEGTASHSSSAFEVCVREGTPSNSVSADEHDVEGSAAEGCLGHASECSKRLSRERTSSEFDLAEVRLSETMPVRRIEST